MKVIHSIRSGALAGAASAFTFVIVHDIFISDIWFSLPLMIVAGAACGLCIGWTYGMLFEKPSTLSWLKYNAVYLVMFAFIGILSVLIFDPITTIGELIASSGPPDHLIKQAMPMTIISTLVMAAAISILYGRSWAHLAAILLTCTVLVLLLGLNVSVIGLVSIPGSSLYLIGELFGLILALNLVFALGFIGLEWKTLAKKDQ